MAKIDIPKTYETHKLRQFYTTAKLRNMKLVIDGVMEGIMVV